MLHTVKVESESHHVPWLAVIGLVIGIFISGSEELVISALLIDLAESFGSTVDMIAYSISVFGIAVILGAPLIALFEDRTSRSTTLLLGMSLFIIGTIICALAPSILVFFIGRFFSGLAAGAFIPMAYAFVGDHTSERMRGKIMGIIVSSWSLSLVFGVPIGAIIGDWYSWRWVFIFFVVLGVLAMILIRYDQKVYQRERVVIFKHKEHGQPLLKSFMAAIQTPFVPSLIFITFCNMLGFYGMYSYFGSYFRSTFSSGSAFVGVVVVIYGIGFASILFTGRFVDKINKKQALTYSMLALSVILFMIPHIARILPILAVILFIWGVLQSFIVTLLSTSLNESSKRYRGRILALYSLTSNLAVTIGAGVMGPVYSGYGYVTVAIMCSAFTFIGLIVGFKAFFFSKNNKKQYNLPSTN
ncbi:MFS transporter [Cytobacillus sp. FJAT-54145]|uniref:MFS transporter n=1 Tax=Cytobacillus spartinae TaxID=3299023 RepID=A0ABW6KE31_9BACI